MLYCTGFLAFTGTGETSSPRQITLYNSVTRAVIKTLSLPTTVLSIQLNRQYMAVVLELKTMIYSIGENVDLLCTVPTPSNPRGIAALSLPWSTSGNNKVFLAVPGGVDHSKGVIHIHDVSKKGKGSVLEIEAHRTPLGLLTWSPDGTMLASASVKGTVVRVFDGQQGTKLWTLRRGTTPTRITSMEFSNPSTRGTPRLLLVASDRGSVHIFKLIDNSARNPITRMKSMTKSLFSAMRHKTATSCGVRIAKIELPCPLGTAAVTSFRPSSSEEKEDDLKIQIATGEGILYQYSITEWKEKDVAQTVAEGQWVFA
jgi:autophagy-related protein 18